MSHQMLSIEELTERFYSVKEQRDRFLAFCRVVCPESPKGASVWDHEVGAMFRELLDKDRAKLIELLDRVQCYCPVHVQDEIRAVIKTPRPSHPSRLIEALKAIRDPEHCMTAFTVQGLRDIATAALQEIDPRNDYSGCTGDGMMTDAEALAAVRMGGRCKTTDTILGLEEQESPDPKCVHHWRIVACDFHDDVVECSKCGRQLISKCHCPRG